MRLTHATKHIIRRSEITLRSLAINKTCTALRKALNVNSNAQLLALEGGNPSPQESKAIAFIKKAELYRQQWIKAVALGTKNLRNVIIPAAEGGLFGTLTDGYHYQPLLRMTKSLEVANAVNNHAVAKPNVVASNRS